MRWFRKKNEEHTIFKIQLTPLDKGIHVQFLKGNEEQSLPIRLTPQEYRLVDSLDLLQLIDELWYDEFLIEQEEKYIIPYETIYNLSDDERKLLGLPQNQTFLKMELDNESFVGSPKFKLVPKYHCSGYQNLQRIANRTGALIQLPNKEMILIDREQYEFLDNVVQQPPAQNQDDYFQFLAKIKKQAKNLEVELSNHLEKEEYEFIDQLELDVNKVEDGLKIDSVYKHDELSEEILDSMSNENSSYSKVDGKRIFIDSNIKHKSQKINEIGKITGINIPRFVENPEAFLPEDLGLSLESFGERVRNLGIRVYRAQPFFHANKNDRGWFEFETGYRVKDNEGEVLSNLPDDFFEEPDQEFKQLGEDEYIFTPHNSEEFTEKVKELKQLTKNKEIKDLTKVSFVLEIFENLENIDFNQPIQEIKESLADKKVFENRPPDFFKAMLKPFQVDGFVWMKSLRFSGYGGLLADDMGLGKTVQVIAYLTYLKEQQILTPTLLVLPKSLTENWINEMKKFAPVLTERLYWHQGYDRLKDPKQIEAHDIVLTTYQTLVKDQLILGQVNWQMVILDEAQAIKNPTTAMSKVVKALKNKGRIALTGTPVENTLSELWSIIDFVQPGLLGSLKQFKQNYLNQLDKGELGYEEVQRKLENEIKFIYKRRTKANELKGQLPEKYFEALPCEIGKVQLSHYQAIINQIKEKDIKPIEGIMKLKMLLSHPGLIDPSARKVSASSIPKLEKTLNLIDSIREKEEKVLIFTEYREMQNILKEHILERFGIVPPIINGMTERRQQVVDEFNSTPGFNVMILSPKAAGTGLTITSANNVIHYTRWWNPAVENQATDRVYRIGQEKDVTVYYPIVMANKSSLGKTVEEIVDELLKQKQELATNIIVPSNDLDIEEMLLETITLH